MSSNKTISAQDNPFLFEQIAYTLNLIADATGDSSVLEAFLQTRKSEEIAEEQFFDAIDSNKNGMPDSGDAFATQPPCLANVRAIMAKLRPEFLATNQKTNEIPQRGYVDELFGEFPRDLNNFARIVYVAPLQRIPDKNTANVSVRLENGEERVVGFREYHSGMTDSPMGTSIEEQYDEFITNISQAFGYDEKAAFRIIRAALKDIYDETTEAERRKMIAGLLGGAAYGASVYFGSVAGYQQMWIEAKEVGRLLDRCGEVYDDLLEAPAHVEMFKSWAKEGRVSSRQAMAANTYLVEAKSADEAAGRVYLEADAAFHARYGVPSCEIRFPGEQYQRPRLPKMQRFVISARPLGTLSGFLTSAFRAVGFTALGYAAYSIGSGIKESIWPSEETQLRSNLEKLFSECKTYEEFKAKLDEYPSLRADIRKLWWFISHNGLVSHASAGQ
ncbi:MAG: hypothetical protein A3H42_03445 [Deltaproteobacteria bacterium RIFCSPLOWO2_02_FULL_46_8]|nr:MAG: hypothetical protein A3H42_03445 [Deltaproteobacteria bacterium RIFCSPLOWO2_02_FULL_46_8]